MPNNELTLEDFLTKSTSSELIAKNATQEIAQSVRNNIQLSTLLSGMKEQDKAKEFEDSLVEHVSSPETIKEISKVVGTPKANETEDEFVERSISNIADYLMKSFK